MSVFKLPERPLRLPQWQLKATRYTVHTISIGLLCLAYYRALFGLVIGDPVQYLLDFTGISALNLLALSLLVTPLARNLRFVQAMILRRTFGVYAAIYALAHFIAFIAFELQFEWGFILSEIIQRPYISVGFIALTILSLLLITSNRFSQKKLKANWQSLHNFVYLSVCLGVLHYLWAVKTIGPKPIIYSLLFLLLFYLRREKLLKLIKK